MIALQGIASKALARILNMSDSDARMIDPEANLSAQYGVTSLRRMLLITQICDEAGVDLTMLTEDDVARMQSLRDIVALLERTAQSEV